MRSNNAGVMGTPFMLSQDNIEMQFATNHLGMAFRVNDFGVYVNLN